MQPYNKKERVKKQYKEKKSLWNEIGAKKEKLHSSKARSGVLEGGQGQSITRR